MKAGKPPVPKPMILVLGPLVLASVLFLALPPLAQTQDECGLPEGADPPEEPPVTAQQVEDGSATLMDFALAARDQFSGGQETPEESFYFGCLIRQEGSHWRSGSTYLVSLLADGRVFTHSKDMSLSGRLLNPVIYGTILSSLGVPVANLVNLASPDSATAAQAFGAVMGTLLQGPDAPFDATSPIPGLSEGIPGASGYAVVYRSANFGVPIVLLAGFELDESHVIEEEIDYGDPAVAAGDVVDRETLKAFVTQAGEFIVKFQQSGDLAASSKLRIALRDSNGPWREGSVYLYVLDLASRIVLFHGANPDRFELRPLVGIARDGRTGELILPQVLAAAASDPEGGFVEYYYDDPGDDTDRADIPKLGYAREFKGEFDTGERVVTLNFVVGSGLYRSSPEDVPTGPRMEVEATVLGDAVEGLTVEFSRAISGRQSDYAWSAVTDADGQASLTISGGRQVSGLYQARAHNAAGETVGQWHSIPLNRNQRHVVRLALGGGVWVVRAEPLAAAKSLASAAGLALAAPNPFNSSTQIAYHLSSPGPVQLVIHNVLGQPVRTLVDRFQGAGFYQVEWDARDQHGVSLSSGVYITRLSHPGGVETQRLLYLE